MVEKGLPAPTPKAVTANQTKTKEPPQKNSLKQNRSKTAPPLEPRVVVVPVVSVDQSEDQAPFYPLNQPNQLPDISPNQLDQPPNNPPNQPNPPTNPLTPNQIYQITHLTLQQIHPIQCSQKTLHPKYCNKIGHILNQNFQANQKKMQ